MRPERLKTWVILAAIAVAGLFGPRQASASDGVHCDICGQPFTEHFYILTDKVTGERKQICDRCIKVPDVCFVCGLPVPTNATRLPDGRVLCERDARTAILDNGEASRICTRTIDDLNRVLSRFASFPVKNVQVEVVDRVTLTGLFKMPGNDYDCPNILGYTLSETNHGAPRHRISLMSALTARQLRAVCAHEISHAWVFENVPAARRKSLGRDAHEGFCELVAYLLMNSDQDADGIKAILRNAYTRGQIDCFIASEERFGFNDIVDWMKYGADPLLDCNNPARVRNLLGPAQLPTADMSLPSYTPQPARGPDSLVLMGLVSTPRRPFALINDRTFAAGDTGRVPVGQSNSLIRCLEIRPDAVRIQLLDSGEEKVLRMKDAP
jgi:hypothetical protein